jgi:hypothetical protein
MGRKRPEDRRTVKGTSAKRRSMITAFEERWGIHVKDLALVEGVTPQSIQMRVRNFGTPFQRRAKCTFWEERYGNTLAQLAAQRGVHPMSIERRQRLYNSIDLPPEVNAREDLRNLQWLSSGDWDFGMQSTLFTLADAQARLAQLKQGN